MENEMASQGQDRLNNLVGAKDGIHRQDSVTFGDPVPQGVILTSLDWVVNWVRKSSIWPMTFRVGVLRDRDDVDGRFTFRHCAIRS